MTFEQYKSNFQMPKGLQEILTEEEQETHMLICFCNDPDNFSTNIEDY